MRYIRTKDGIFELANERTITEFQVIDHLYNRAFLKDEILAQANTIEELCDEFVYEFENLKHERCWKGKDTGRWFDYDCDVALTEEQIATIKGAIWTDKGLIYVAKMDENGKLVLI